MTYVGRFVIVAPGVGAYRVSSRSYPNREIVRRNEETLSVVPTDAAEPVDNPYIAYNCLRTLEARAVLGNGSHVDPIAEKLAVGYPARDALAHGLLTLDYERDEHDTPRVAGVVGDWNEDAAIGIVRKDALHVETVREPTLVATYERDVPEPVEFPVETAGAAAGAAYTLEFEHPVAAAGVTVDGTTVRTAIENGNDNTDTDTGDNDDGPDDGAGDAGDAG